MKKLLTAEQMVDKLWKSTTNGKLTLEYMDAHGDVYTQTYPMAWQKEDVPPLLDRFLALKADLDQLAQLYKSLRPTREENAAFLNEHQLDIWDTYIRPYDTHPFDIDKLEELDETLMCGKPLTEEQRRFGAEFEVWRQQQALSRLPEGACSPMDLITAAYRYMRIQDLRAADIMVNIQLFELAKAMVIYHCAKPHNRCFCCDLVHEGDVCPNCGWEEKPLISDADFDNFLAYQHNFFCKK